jgi:hypothetical protein
LYLHQIRSSDLVLLGESLKWIAACREFVGWLFITVTLGALSWLLDVGIWYLQYLCLDSFFQIADLSRDFDPESNPLRTLRSVDLLPNSWLSVAWYVHLICAAIRVPLPSVCVVHWLVCEFVLLWFYIQCRGQCSISVGSIFSHLVTLQLVTWLTNSVSLGICYAHRRVLISGKV